MGYLFLEPLTFRKILHFNNSKSKPMCKVMICTDHILLKNLSNLESIIKHSHFLDKLLAANYKS